jgi:hypothetical protein
LGKVEGAGRPELLLVDCETSSFAFGRVALNKRVDHRFHRDNPRAQAAQVRRPVRRIDFDLVRPMMQLRDVPIRCAKRPRERRHRLRERGDRGFEFVLDHVEPIFGTQPIERVFHIAQSFENQS